MKTNDLKEAFGYTISRKDHFSKFQKKNYLLHHIVFSVSLLFFLPFILVFKFYFKNKIKNKKIKKTVAIVRTKNGLKIAKILKEKNDFQIISLSIKDDNHFSKLTLLMAIYSSFDIYGNYYFIINDFFLSKNLIKTLKVIAFANIEEAIIKKHNIRTLIQFNDHSPESIHLESQCREVNIKTVYIQHAPVSELFPPLYHNLNILFSKDSLNKYRIKDESIKVQLMFDFRFLTGLGYLKDKKNKKSILLCPNLLDDIKEVEKLAFLLEENNYLVKVRMHPADKRGLKGSFRISDEKNIWKDLSTTEIVITNESAVPLEASFLNCLVYKAGFWSESIDAYSFLRNNFILKEEKSIRECVNSVKELKDRIDKSKLSYYIGDVSMTENLKLNI